MRNQLLVQGGGYPPLKPNFWQLKLGLGEGKPPP